MRLSCSFADVLLERIGTDGPDAALGRAVMSDEEAVRGARFYFPKDRDQHARSRYVLRREFSRLLGREPSAIEFATGERGKPYLAGEAGWEFNLSHSGGWMALAWNHKGVPVGVDVEVQRADFPALEIAERFFRPNECVRLRACGEGRRVELFFHLWTAKEAIMKATGHGFALVPRNIEVELDAEDRPTGYSVLEGVEGSPGDWRLECWRPFPNVVVCAAGRCGKFD